MERVIGIRIAVALIGLFAPTSSPDPQQRHLPLAAFSAWSSGRIGTLIFLWAMGKLRGTALAGVS